MRLKRPVENPTILGFDTEFTSDGRLLSIQLAALMTSKPVSRVYYASSIDKAGLFKLVQDFCQELGVEVSDYVVLVAHFATAEISHISNFLSDFHLRTYNRALEGSTEIEYLDAPGRDALFVYGDEKMGKVKLRIVDLYGFYVMGLEKIGWMFRRRKVSLRGVGGESEDYWKGHMAELLHRFPRKFKEYAKRDAEVTVLAYVRMREFYLREFGIDILHYKTTPGLAMAVFRSRYLIEPAVPFDLRPEPYHYKNKTGKWKLGFRNRTFLKEEWRTVRRSGFLAYWGGRNESYGRGILRAPVVLYDVDSLYPAAAALQPLPCSHSHWRDFATIEATQSLEGFAYVEFEFPSDCVYPCLPVPGELSDTLYFPLKGRTWCTLAEVREAVRLNAKITTIKGVGFIPTSQEIDHPVRRYALDFMERKRDSEKGAKRETDKLLLNSLMGKFVETQKDVELGQVLALIKRGTITAQQAPIVYREKQSPFRKRPRDVGIGWWIEAASLILGKARALMSQFISKGALMGVTDSVLLPTTTAIACSALDELQSVGSGLIPICKAESFWTLRTRVYVLWNKKGRPIKWAKHAFPLADSSFLGWVRECIKRGEAIPLTTRKTHLVSLKEAIQRGKTLGQQETKETHPKLEGDHKRRETTKTNPFGQWAFYPPHVTVPEIMRKRGRPRKNNSTRENG